MTDENKPTEVLIEREGRTWRWGQSEYLQNWNGLKQTINVVAMKMMAIPAALAMGALTFFFSGQKEAADNRGREMEMPNITRDFPIISAPILDNKDLPNTLRQPKVGLGVVGKIQVFNLRELTAIPVGSEAKAVLESGASNGIVKARLISALIVDGESILPEGTTLFGRGKSSDERLFVEFQKAIFPTGESFAIRGQAFDVDDKILGLRGSIVGTRTKKMGAAIGFGILGGLADGLQETSGSSIWGTQQKKSLRDAALSGASKAALDQSQAAIDEMKNSPNIIEVKKGTEFYLIIDEPKKEENH